MTAELSERERVLHLLKLHGWNTTSFQLLEPDFQYWFDRASGCVAYVETAHARVVAGAPISRIEDMASVVDAFVQQCRIDKKRVVFFAVEERFLAGVPMAALPVGEQPVWIPALWDEGLRTHRSLREQLRRSRAKGVTVARVPSAEVCAGDVRPQIEALLTRWLASRPMPQMAFLVDLDPFSFAEERRYYLARRKETICGLLVTVPVFGRNGWFLEDLIRDPGAPNGTAELLIDCAMRDCASEGAEFVTFGLAPLTGDVGLLRHARSLLSAFYSFDGLRAFKARLRPQRWEPVFLAFPRDSWAILAIYDSLSAFARGRPFLFAMRAVLRASSFMVRLLAVLLAVWTVLLALPAAERFFPGNPARWCWVAFDCCQVVALHSLSRRWRKRLALTCAITITGDAALTAWQAVSYNLPRLRGAADMAVVLAATAGPILAAVFLWSGIVRRRR